VVHPDHDEERRRVETLARAVDAAASAHRDDLARVHKAVRTLSEGMLDQVRDRDRAVLRGFHQIETAVARQYRMTSAALRVAEWKEGDRVRERRLRSRLGRLARTDGPVIVGPWTGEVGFELLYWIPFVAWALQEAHVAPERIVIVSRGGTAPWYRRLGTRYVDALAIVTPEEFRAATEGETKKQYTVRPFDRRLVRAAMRAEGLRRPFLLHPGLMYPIFEPFWRHEASFRRVEAFTAPHLFDRAALPVLDGLPRDYVAVRFYFSGSFPDTPANRRFVDGIIGRLRQSVDVVLLNAGLNVDDHADYAPGPGPRIHSVAHRMTPADNLAVQSAVVANARAFVGTYGGYAYLAPLYGVDAIAFYADYDKFFPHHLDFAQRVFHRLGAGSLVPLDVRDAALVQLALAPRATPMPASTPT
jgi:hypothetical protein